VSVFIIAEAGVNHNGSVDLALELIDAAVDSGADAVKFQTFKAENLVTKSAKKANYQIQKNTSTESQHEMLKKLELDFEDHEKLFKYCNKNNIIFLSTPFDTESIDLLDNLGLELFKIPSGEITNLKHLRHVGSLCKQVVMSTGMATIEEIQEALDVLINSGTPKKNITILHANTMYPTPMEDVNLRAMKTIKDKFGVSVGYSDHTLGIEVDVAAVAMGAVMIEKHFTLDKTMDGPDHKSSISTAELKAMVNAIRNIEKALGSSEKKPTNSEKVNLIAARKSIVASKPIKKGEFFSNDNLTVKRPAEGLSPMKWDKIIGKVADRDYQIDDFL
jgi:N,N'-diacetyllegionaminate synthase